MERLGVDFNATGSVMTRRELEEQRRKRGECLTCGRKCYHKKLFKMVPITDHGRVLEGRCLNCKPLEVNSNQTVLPAETRAATRSELERFNRSQRNLTASGPPSASGGGGRGDLGAARAASARPGGRPDYARARSTDNVAVGSSAGAGAGAGGSRQNHARDSSASAPSLADPAESGGQSSNAHEAMGTSVSAAFAAHTIAARFRANRAPSNGGLDAGDDPEVDCGHGGGGGGGRPSQSQSGQSERAPPAAASSRSLGSMGSGYRNSPIPEGSEGSSERTPAQTQGLGGLLNRGGAVNLKSNDGQQSQRTSYSRNDEEVPAQAVSHLNLNAGDDRGAPAEPRDEEERILVEKLNDPDLSYEEVISIMRSKKSSPLIQEEALLALSEIVLEEPDHDRLAKHGGLKCAIAAMKAHSGSVHVQIAGCQALWNLSATPKSQVAIGAAGGIVAILAAMSNFEGDADLQENAMAALSNLGASDANHPIIVEHGGVRKVVEAMNCHSENTSVQEKGCAALTNLASKDASVKAAITAAGGADAVVISMVMHPGDIELQQKALRALRNLCANDDENKVLVANVGGIDAVIGAMQVHRDDPGVQEAGAWTLSNLAVNAENKAIIGESGGIDVIVRAMWVHSDSPGVQEWACRALWTLSVDKSNKEIIIEVGGISAVVNAMQAHVDGAAVQEKGCGLLSNLAANDDRNKIRIVEEEALDAIVMAMVLHGDNKLVQERACTVLRKLCFGPNIKPMQAANVAALMQAAAEKFPEQCQEKAEYVVGML